MLKEEDLKFISGPQLCQPVCLSKYGEWGASIERCEGSNESRGLCRHIFKFHTWRRLKLRNGGLFYGLVWTLNSDEIGSLLSIAGGGKSNDRSLIVGTWWQNHGHDGTLHTRSKVICSCKRSCMHLSARDMDSSKRNKDPNTLYVERIGYHKG